MPFGYAHLMVFVGTTGSGSLVVLPHGRTHNFGAGAAAACSYSPATSKENREWIKSCNSRIILNAIGFGPDLLFLVEVCSSMCKACMLQPKTSQGQELMFYDYVGSREKIR